MAYSEKQLNYEWIPQVRFPNGENVNLMVIRDLIQEEADANGIPVAFGEDKLKVGGLLSSQLEDILIMYNPEHPTDYLRFAIRVMHQGKYAFMHVYNLGGSKNYRASNMHGTAATIMKGLGGHRAKLQEEENYYTILADCLANIIG